MALILKCKQQTKKVELKAADFIKVDDETSAIVANTGNGIVALKIDLNLLFLKETEVWDRSKIPVFLHLRWCHVKIEILSPFKVLNKSHLKLSFTLDLFSFIKYCP